MEGWIKIHRSILEWEWYEDLNTFRLFIHLLLTANHEDKNWRGVLVRRGQLITSVANLSKITGLSEQSVRTSINKLKKTFELTSKTTSHYTIITICKYNDYQDIEITTNKPTNKPTNKRATNEQQTANKPLTTTKEGKKERIKEGKNKEYPSLFFVSPNFLPVWNKWLTYRKEIKKPYRTETGMKTKYNELVLLSGDDASKAMQIVDQSIGNEWTGFFALKVNGKNTSDLLPGEDKYDKLMREGMELLKNSK